MDRNKKIIACRINLSKRFPYMSDLISAIRVDFTKETLTGTDGKTIYISDKTIKTFGGADDAEMFLFTHEILHLALKHLPRFKSLNMLPKEHFLFNVLADYKVNQICLNNLPLSAKTKDSIHSNGVDCRSILEILDQGLNPGWQKVIENHGFENIDRAFRLLRPFVKDNAWGLGKNPGPGTKGRGVVEGHDFGKNYTEEADEQVKRQMAGSIMGSKLAGKTPGSLLSELEGMWFKQEVNWRKLISSHIKTRIREGRTWNKLHRRSFVM